jgi:hypothetical protein
VCTITRGRDDLLGSIGDVKEFFFLYKSEHHPPRAPDTGWCEVRAAEPVEIFSRPCLRKICPGQWDQTNDDPLLNISGARVAFASEWQLRLQIRPVAELAMGNVEANWKH